jgi:deoxyribose-phosphate aldolase
MTTKELAKMIDHSILHPTFTDDDLNRECEVATKYDVASVCVKPYMVPSAVEKLKGTNVLVGCVIGFPAGNSTIESKIHETKSACENGAVEIDMVINIGKALQGDWNYIEEEIAEVTRTCHEHGAIVKVIFETDYINREGDTGFGFVKGEDGKYSYTGATIPILKLMKSSVGPEVKVKAAGGVRTLDQLIEVMDAGCSRCGATATISMMEEAHKRFGN